MASTDSYMATARNRRRHTRAIHLIVVVALIIASALAIEGTASAQTVVATISVGTAPLGVAVNSSTNRIYVANSSSKSVSVIDGTIGSPTENQVIATIGVGYMPTDVAVNPNTNRIYVTNNGANTVSVIDGGTNSVVATVQVGQSPTGVAVNPSTNRVYVANFGFGANSLSVIDGSTNTVVATIPAGTGPLGVAVLNPTSSLNRIYVADFAYGANSVSAIDASNNSLTTIPVGTSPVGVGVNANTDRVYVSNSGSGANSVSVINGTNNSVVATVPVGSTPKGVGVNPNTNNAYVANYFGNSVSIVDGASNSVTATVAVGSRPYGVAVNPTTNRVYVTNQYDNNVSVIQDAQSRTVASTTTTVSNATTQYSDAVTLSASVSPRSLNGQTLTGTVAFSINGQAVGSAAVNTSTGVASLNVPSVQLAAGNYPIVATFTSTNPSFADSNGSGTLTVTREDATVTPALSNPTAVKVNAPGGSAGPLTLSATIAEVADDSTPGDISKAVPVTFSLTPIGPGTTYTCVASSGMVSTGKLAVNCTFPSVAVNDYEIQIVIGGSYYQGSADPTLVVFDPSSGFATGGGTVVHNGAGANFSIDAKYVANGKWAGSLVYVEHRSTGDVVLRSSGIQYVVIVNGKVAYIGGTATINGAGSYSFLATTVDNGEPGKNDQFGLQVKDSSGNTVANLTFSPLTLTGGNVAVPHK